MKQHLLSLVLIISSFSAIAGNPEEIEKLHAEIGEFGSLRLLSEDIYRFTPHRKLSIKERLEGLNPLKVRLAQLTQRSFIEMSTPQPGQFLLDLRSK